MEKGLILGLRQDINEMILEHLRVRENKIVLKNKQTKYTHNDSCMSKEHESNESVLIA